jgi:HPr kinase/phosphorylase
MLLVHGTCVAIDEFGVLIIGPPGSGKSDLALRLVDLGARLVADDYLYVEASGQELLATVPDTIAGMMEVRGLGIVTLPYLDTCRVGLCVELVEPARVPRLPTSGRLTTFENLDIPSFELSPFEASAAAKVKLAVRAVRDGIVLTE